MTDLRTIATTAAGIFGGTPKVITYYDDDETNSVEILSCTPSPGPGLTSYSTIGMSLFDNEMTYDGKPARVELVGAAADAWTVFAEGLSSCAFTLAHDEYQIKPGIVFPGVFAGYGHDVTTPHALIWFPFVWSGDFEPMADDDVHIEWLTAIPITDGEYAFFEANDADSLIDIFERESVDIYDLGRASAVTAVAGSG